MLFCSKDLKANLSGAVLAVDGFRRNPPVAPAEINTKPNCRNGRDSHLSSSRMRISDSNRSNLEGPHFFKVGFNYTLIGWGVAGFGDGFYFKSNSSTRYSWTWNSHQIVSKKKGGGSLSSQKEGMTVWRCWRWDIRGWSHDACFHELCDGFPLLKP